MKALTAKIAGRRRYDAVIAAAALIVFRRERDNTVDPRAVAVYADGQKVGYLEAGLSEWVGPFLDRGRPVYGSPTGSQGSINVFVPQRRDRLAPAVGATLIEVPSSDGVRRYVVDPRNRLCTCPAGRWVNCRHKISIGTPRRTRALVAA